MLLVITFYRSAFYSGSNNGKLLKTTNVIKVQALILMSLQTIFQSYGTPRSEAGSLSSLALACLS